LDLIDKELLSLFEKRMEIGTEIADIKKKGNLALSDETREQFIVERALSLTDRRYSSEISLLMRALISLSKIWQRKQLYDVAEADLLPSPRSPEKGNTEIAYQGAPGAFGEQAALKLYPNENRTAYRRFEDVFKAVSSKEVSYGIIPVENSQTGAIGEVYDLLRRYGCYIVGQTWIEVKHCLIGLPGTRLSDIRTVYSHPEGFKQCDSFLKDQPWDLAACSNTAAAANMIAKEGNKRNAAIGSRRAALLNGLEVISEDVMDDPGNKTRFIAISDSPEYDKTCDAVSMIFRAAHRSGALAEVLFPFMAGGVNLTRIESRPMSGGKYCFFCDISGNILDEKVAFVIRQAAASCGHLEVLGCYKEG
jgi:chorismate mutase/prephenate dehydratase